jgi:hypothetical protein
MKFFASIIFMMFFSLPGFAQQQQNQLRKPDMVQPRPANKGNVTRTVNQPAQKTMTDFDKVAPSKSTAKPVEGQDKKAPRQLTPLDPNKVVKGKN